MADQPQQTSDTAAVINHVVDKMSDGIAHATKMVEAGVPKALEMAVHGIWAQGLATLIVGAVFFFGGIFLATVALVIGFKSEWEDPNPQNLFCVFGTIAGIILFIVGIINFSDTTAWAKVLSPDGYLAQQILSSALGNH